MAPLLADHGARAGSDDVAAARPQYRPDNVRCQAGHPEHFADPSRLKLEAAGQFRCVGYLAGVNHLLPVEGLANGADQG